MCTVLNHSSFESASELIVFTHYIGMIIPLHTHVLLRYFRKILLYSTLHETVNGVWVYALPYADQTFLNLRLLTPHI